MNNNFNIVRKVFDSQLGNNHNNHKPIWKNPCKVLCCSHHRMWVLSQPNCLRKKKYIKMGLSFRIQVILGSEFTTHGQLPSGLATHWWLRRPPIVPSQPFPVQPFLQHIPSPHQEHSPSLRPQPHQQSFPAFCRPVLVSVSVPVSLQFYRK